MKVNPISTNNINFEAKIINNPDLEKGYAMAERCANTMLMKDLDLAKDFVESLQKIKASDKIDTFEIGIDKRRPNYTYTKINGRRHYGGANEFQQNLQDDYLVVTGCKKYASKLGGTEPTKLDNIKNDINKTMDKLYKLKEKYAEEIQHQLKELQLG